MGGGEAGEVFPGEEEGDEEGEAASVEVAMPKFKPVKSIQAKKKARKVKSAIPPRYKEMGRHSQLDVPKRRSKIGAPNQWGTQELSPAEEKAAAKKVDAWLKKRAKKKATNKVGSGAHRSTGTASRPMLPGTVVVTAKRKKKGKKKKGK